MRFAVLAIFVVAVAAPSYAFKFNIPGLNLPKINLPDITDITKPIQDAIENIVDKSTNDILRLVKSSDKETALRRVDIFVDDTERLLDQAVKVTSPFPGLSTGVREGVKLATAGLEEFRSKSKEIISTADVKTEEGLNKASAQIKSIVNEVVSDINRIFGKPQPEPESEQ